MGVACDWMWEVVYEADCQCEGDWGDVLAVDFCLVGGGMAG